MKLQKGNLEHHCKVKGLLYPKLFSHYGCWVLDPGNSTLATNKKSSDGGEGDDSEDAMRMGVKTKILASNQRAIVTLVMRNVPLHSFFPFSNNYELSPSCQELSLGVSWCWEPTGWIRVKTWRQRREGNKQVQLRHVGGEKTGRRLKCFRSRGSTALQGSSSDFRISGTTPLMSSAKQKELVEWHLCSPTGGHQSTRQILDFPNNMEP